MENEFVIYDTALALKELGFDEPCLGYSKDKEFKMWSAYDCYKNSEMKPWFVTHPFYQQAFRWFREKHGKTAILFSDGFKWTFDLRWVDIDDISNYPFVQFPIKEVRREMFDTFEEAELASLNKLIEIVK
jgi:hypothetical protein